METMRYIERRQSKGTWCVWDRVFNLPTEIDGRMLVGLSQEASEANDAWLGWRPGKREHAGFAIAFWDRSVVRLALVSETYIFRRLTIMDRSKR